MSCDLEKDELTEPGSRMVHGVVAGSPARRWQVQLFTQLQALRTVAADVPTPRTASTSPDAVPAKSAQQLTEPSGKRSRTVQVLELTTRLNSAGVGVGVGAGVGVGGGAHCPVMLTKRTGTAGSLSRARTTWNGTRLAGTRADQATPAGPPAKRLQPRPPSGPQPPQRTLRTSSIAAPPETA